MQSCLAVICTIKPVRRAQWGRGSVTWKCCIESITDRCAMSAIAPSISSRSALGSCMPLPCAIKAQPVAHQKLSSAGYITNYCTLWTAMTMWTTVDTSGHLLLLRLLWSGTWHKQFISPLLVASMICYWFRLHCKECVCLVGDCCVLCRFSTSSSNSHSSQLSSFCTLASLTGPNVSIMMYTWLCAPCSFFMVPSVLMGLDRWLWKSWMSLSLLHDTIMFSKDSKSLIIALCTLIPFPKVISKIFASR